jgi:hypothetical protein
MGSQQGVCANLVRFNPPGQCCATPRSLRRAAVSFSVLFGSILLQNLVVPLHLRATAESAEYQESDQHEQRKRDPHSLHSESGYVQVASRVPSIAAVRRIVWDVSTSIHRPIRGRGEQLVTQYSIATSELAAGVYFDARLEMRPRRPEAAGANATNAGAWLVATQSPIQIGSWDGRNALSVTLLRLLCKKRESPHVSGIQACPTLL